MKDEELWMKNEGGLFLMNGQNIFDCIVAFATENQVLTQSMKTILIKSTASDGQYAD